MFKLTLIGLAAAVSMATSQDESAYSIFNKNAHEGINVETMSLKSHPVQNFPKDFEVHVTYKHWFPAKNFTQIIDKWVIKTSATLNSEIVTEINDDGYKIYRDNYNTANSTARLIYDSRSANCWTASVGPNDLEA